MGFLKSTKGSVISEFFKPLQDLGPIKADAGVEQDRGPCSTFEPCRSTFLGAWGAPRALSRKSAVPVGTHLVHLRTGCKH